MDHLVRIVYKQCYKDGHYTNWILTDNILLKLRTLIQHIMDSITCYDSNTNLTNILNNAPKAMGVA